MFFKLIIWEYTSHWVQGSTGSDTLYYSECWDNIRKHKRIPITKRLDYFDPSIESIFAYNSELWKIRETQIARFMGPTWDPPGSDSTQVGPNAGNTLDFPEEQSTSLPQKKSIIKTSMQQQLNYERWSNRLETRKLRFQDPLLAYYLKQQAL